MFTSKLVSRNSLILILCLFGTASLAQAKDLSALQTALQIAQDELENAKAERDADANRLSAVEKEWERISKLLESERKKASQSESRYQESRKKHDKAQAALDQAWKQ